MSTNVQPFGKPEETKKSEGNTAQEKKESAQANEPKGNDSSMPSGVNKDVWAQAESAVMNKNGGMAGVGPEGRKAQIQEQYDQIVENNKQTERWAGDSNLLGDKK